MSGGHWDHRQWDVCTLLKEIGEDAIVYRRFSKISQVFSDLSVFLEEIIHDLDWDFSCDSLIENDEEFEQIFIEKIGKIISKNFKLKIYEVEEE